MATCARCGRPFIKKRPDGRRKCKSCGFLPGINKLNRDGNKYEQRNNRIKGKLT